MCAVRQTASSVATAHATVLSHGQSIDSLTELTQCSSANIQQLCFVMCGRTYIWAVKFHFDFAIF